MIWKLSLCFSKRCLKKICANLCLLYFCALDTTWRHASKISTTCGSRCLFLKYSQTGAEPKALTKRTQKVVRSRGGLILHIREPDGINFWLLPITYCKSVRAPAEALFRDFRFLLFERVNPHGKIEQINGRRGLTHTRTRDHKLSAFPDQFLQNTLNIFGPIFCPFCANRLIQLLTKNVHASFMG